MMDERVAQRRKGVSEDRARRRLRWILGTIVVVLVVAASAWLIRSPVLSIDVVEVTGASQSDPSSYVEALEMGIGTPTVDVSAGEIELAIEADPWVADASVRVSWPGSVTVHVTEHVPIAVIRAGDEWYVTSIDGSVVAPGDQDGGLPVVEIDLAAVGVGESTDDAMILGAVAFVAELAPELASDAVVSVRDEDLHVTIGGHDVRLGRPDDLALKAIVLAELLESGLIEGASIDLIAPTRPAVRNPQPEVEAEE
jgi:cell division protein FtsQ